MNLVLSGPATSTNGQTSTLKICLAKKKQKAKQTAKAISALIRRERNSIR